MEQLEEVYAFIFSEWWRTFLFFLLFFVLLYFGGTLTASAIVKHLVRKGILRPIQHALKHGQVVKEIRLSLLSIFVFALQAIPMQWMIQRGYFRIGFSNAWNCTWEIPVLFLWNEIHFYAVHWLLHRKWLIKKVHYLHHLSKEPTVYSVFSFHWIEAFLLGTVIFFPLLFHSFHLFSVLSLPLISIVLNLAGHCNHEADTNKGINDISRFTFRHTMHHKWGNGNFGFMLPWMDALFKTSLPKNKN